MNLAVYVTQKNLNKPRTAFKPLEVSHELRDFPQFPAIIYCISKY